MAHRNLPQRLRTIAALTAAAAACSSDAFDGLAPACTGAPITSGFRPAVPVDFLAFRTEQLFYTSKPVVDAGAEAGTADAEAGDGGAGELQYEPTYTSHDSGQHGILCATATDRAGCQRRYAELRRVTEQSCPTSSYGGFGGGRGEPAMAGCNAGYLIYTRGDEVGVVQPGDEVIGFLAPIDTKEEAFYVASQRGYGQWCNSDPKSGWREVDGAFEISTQDNKSSCTGEGGHRDEVVVRVGRDGRVEEVARRVIEKLGPCSEGRRPAGLREPAHGAPRNEVGGYFARCAHLEAASVVAFERLEGELATLRAPDALLRRLRAARADEVRHARSVGRLASRFGATPAPVRVRTARRRTALAIALENAREGCVRETLGATVALYRASRARDPEVARTMRAIAEDEIRHARLSWDLADWLGTVLTPQQRGRVRRAMERELAKLRAEIACEPGPELEAVAGVPTAAAMRELFTRLEATVWRPALAA